MNINNVNISWAGNFRLNYDYKKVRILHYEHSLHFYADFIDRL